MAEPFLVWSAGCSQRRRTLHAGHGAERVCANHSPVFAFAFWPPTSRRPCSKRRSWVFTRRVVAACAACTEAQILLRGRDPESERVRVVPDLRKLIEFRRLNFMDADYGLAEQGRRHLLPQRHHLLRPCHAGEHSPQTDAQPRARAAICSSVTRRHCTIWICPLSRGSCTLQESSCPSLN